MQVFGDPNQPIDLEFPTEADCDTLPLDKKIKLETLVWKNYDNLMAMQLKFTNGVESPIFQKDAVEKEPATGSWAEKHADIDTSKSIRKVSIKVRKTNNLMYAMRLTDDSGVHVVDVEWDTHSAAKWVTHDIPDGQEIIGLYMSKKGKSYDIQSLGFILWKPNPSAIE